jgi:hypothetical protein
MSDRELIAVGWYDAQLRKQGDLWFDLGVSDSGLEYIFVVFEITTGEHQGKARRARFYLSPGAFPHTVKKLRAVGLRGDDFEPESPSVMAQDLGKPVRIKIEHEERDGRIYEDIAFVSANGGGVKKRIDPHARASFAARMRAQLATLGEPSPATKPNTPDVLDDLGF